MVGEQINVLSCFDGMSGGQLALKKLGINVANYYASEIDKHAIKVTQHNFPDTVQLGDITKWKEWNIDFGSIDLILSGSPCQGFSFAGKGLAFDDPRSKLFFVFVEIYNHVKNLNPNVKFLLENVQMKAEHEIVISRYMGVNPIVINSALVSAQNRVRNYWTNINEQPYGLFEEMMPNIPQPKDKGILLKDILEADVDDKYYISEKALQRVLRTGWSNPQFNPDKTGTILPKNNSGQLSVDSGTTLIIDVYGNPKRNQNTAGAHTGGNHSDMDLVVEQPQHYEISCNCGCVYNGRLNDTCPKCNMIQGGYTNPVRGVIQLNPNNESGGKQPYQQNRVYGTNGLSPALCENKSDLLISDDTPRIRRLTEVEVCRLQTVPDDYFFKDGKPIISSTQIYRCIGNGWTVDVIAHILSLAMIYECTQKF